MMKLIKSNQNAAETFTARSYYDRNFLGLEDSVENVSLSEAEDFCHEHLMNGGYVELEDDFSSKVACAPCPDGGQSPAGSTSVEQCTGGTVVCLEGEYKNDIQSI